MSTNAINAFMIVTSHGRKILKVLRNKQIKESN
jgi:hypothetical protein